MKNRIPNFDEFLFESINEKKDLSPANIKQYNANANSVKALKSWSYKIKDANFTFKDMEYWGDVSRFFTFIENTNTNNAELVLNVNGSHDARVTISTYDNKFDMSASVNMNTLYFNIKKSQQLQYCIEADDKVAGFIELLNFLFKTYEEQISKFVKDKEGLQTLYVIKAGEIAPATGKTGHGWSIYDYPNGVLGATNGGSMMLWSAEGFKVGDKFKIVDDQTHKLITNEVEIVALIPATYKDFVAYSSRRGAEVPVRAFQKQTGRFRFTLYSIK
ncbi:MAG: hypothetical protein WC979_01310 [Candidatus Pacearchaeota archaeon]|jgi:hypothetical protein|nr:hypothetical protein [Clostridia bacterium]